MKKIKQSKLKHLFVLFSIATIGTQITACESGVIQEEIVPPIAIGDNDPIFNQAADINYIESEDLKNLTAELNILEMNQETRTSHTQDCGYDDDTGAYSGSNLSYICEFLSTDRDNIPRYYSNKLFLKRFNAPSLSLEISNSRPLGGAEQGYINVTDPYLEMGLITIDQTTMLIDYANYRNIAISSVRINNLMHIDFSDTNGDYPTKSYIVEESNLGGGILTLGLSEIDGEDNQNVWLSFFSLLDPRIEDLSIQNVENLVNRGSDEQRSSLSFAKIDDNTFLISGSKLSYREPGFENHIDAALVKISAQGIAQVISTHRFNDANLQTPFAREITKIDNNLYALATANGVSLLEVGPQTLFTRAEFAIPNMEIGKIHYDSSLQSLYVIGAPASESKEQMVKIDLHAMTVKEVIRTNLHVNDFMSREWNVYGELRDIAYSGISYRTNDISPLLCDVYQSDISILERNVEPSIGYKVGFFEPLLLCVEE